MYTFKILSLAAKITFIDTTVLAIIDIGVVKKVAYITNCAKSDNFISPLLTSNPAKRTTTIIPIWKIKLFIVIIIDLTLAFFKPTL